MEIRHPYTFGPRVTVGSIRITVIGRLTYRTPDNECSCFVKFPRYLPFPHHLKFPQAIMNEIFPEIVRAIKTGEPEVLQYDDIDPEDAQQHIDSIRHRPNQLERYPHRYSGPGCSLESCFRWGLMLSHWISIHYSSLACSFKIVMPTRLHECTAGWIMNCLIEPIAFPSVVAESG